MANIFADIIAGKLPAKIVYESDNVIAIEDKYPQAPVHLLIMPKKEYESLQAIPESDLGVLAEIVKCAQDLAIKYKCTNDYRFLTNVGSMAGQTIFHLHFHLIGGRKLGSMA